MIINTSSTIKNKIKNKKNKTIIKKLALLNPIKIFSLPQKLTVNMLNKRKKIQKKNKCLKIASKKKRQRTAIKLLK